MIKNFRRILIIAIAVVVVASGPLALLDYFLPHHRVLRIVGTEIKRVDATGRTSKDKAPGQTHDVYYVYAEDVETKKPHVFRNEDTGWGFPWYLKFDSADVQATAQSIAGERGTAIFTYYGWRIQIFSLMPNAVKIVRAAPDATVFPWFNVAFFAVLLGAIAWIVLRIRGLGRWWTSKRRGGGETIRG